MTTVAYKDGVMAADSQVTFNGHTKNPSTSILKLFRSRDHKTVYGVSGTLPYIMAFKHWLEKEKLDPKKAPELKDNEEAVIIGVTILANGKFKTIRMFEKSKWLNPFSEYEAIGSGYLAALAAMMCGHSAIQAVSVASKFCSFTNNEINYAKVVNGKWQIRKATQSEKDL